MADFNSDEPGSNPDSSAPKLSGSDKLKSLLAKSRAVAGNEPDDGDFEDEATAMTSIPEDEPSEDLAERTSPDQAVPAALSGEVPAAASTSSDAIPQVPPKPQPPQQSQQPFQMNPSASYSGPLPANLQSGMMPNPYQSQSVPLSPSGEFGIIPDIGVSQTPNEVASSEPPSAKKRRATAVGVTVLIGIIAFFIIGKLIVDQWVSPGRAVVWMAAGIGIPTALVGIILAWPNRENGSMKDTLSGLIPAIALTIGAVVIAGSWSQGAVRAQAVPFAPMTPQIMTTILEDDEDVAIAGCERYGARYDDTDFRTRLFSILTLRPSLAMACMGKLPDDVRAAIATSLSDRWTRELLADEKEPDQTRLCATAGGLSSLDLDPSEVRGRLLQCTLNAPNEIAQQCCADSLATTVVDPKQWAKHLRETIPFARDPYTSTGVFAMAFHQEGLTKPQKDFAKKVNFQSPQAQLASLEFACDAVGNGSANVVRHMQAALDGECPVDAGNVPSSETVWQEICFLTIAEIEADRTRPPVSTMCAMTRDVVTAAAVETASNLVTLALRRDFKGALSQQIEGGYNLLLDNLTNPDNPDRLEKPDFVAQEDVDYARTNREMGGDPSTHNFEFRTPGDDDFQAFLKAYRAKEPWKDRKLALEREKAKKKDKD